MNKNILVNLTKNFFVGFMIIIGGASALIGVTAFESLTSNPSDSGNQSLNSPILSQIAGTFNRETMSLEAIAKGSVNWRDCETKKGDITSGSTVLTCSAGYTIVDHSCSSGDARYGTYAISSCYLTSNDSLTLTWAGNNSTWHSVGSIKCCKYLVP